MATVCNLSLRLWRPVVVALLMVGGAGAAWGDDAVELLVSQAPTGELEGWECYSEEALQSTADVWQLRDGILRCAGTPKGYLYTRKAYRDFTLTLQWRWPPGAAPGNGGVLIRMTGQHRIWPRSFEAQLNAGQAGDIWGLDGFVLDGPADRVQTADHPQFGALKNVRKLADRERPAGEWNDCEVTAEGGVVTIRINGEEVNQAHGCALDAGPICLTAEGDVIEFRAVRLTAR